MANNTSIADIAKTLVSNVKNYWKVPIPGRYMNFREIAAYAGGGIGAYMIITLGIACLLATGNTLISSTLGVGATDMYIMYVIAVLANIPLTGIRANIIDNTRNKAGKYRPYIVTMAIPTAIICITMVWFPYNSLESIFGTELVFGREKAYVVKCAIIMVLNLLLHFFYYFFYDAYENLIHVLSPNSQERADVSSVKSVVYSLAPTIVNLLTPVIASNIFHTNMTDIRVYRLLYPILGVLGILLCIFVYKYTEEKIVQARTHIVQIKFTDAIREVAKNKYFWIISLAGWIGFLESAYVNILNWLYNYGGACSGNVFGIVVTVYGNASLWGMVLAPVCIRKWGKKAVLVVTNLFNILFILLMLPFTSEINNMTIWLVMGCMYLNAFMSSFMHILNPAIQADIRDYQQYKTGERIDGMFSAVATIGTVVALVTSSVLPVIYEKGGITKANATVVTSNPSILNRMLGDGKTVGTLLQEQLAQGQDNYHNAFSALYDPDILIKLLHVLIIVSAVGALMNVIPFFWYDFNEKKQKSVVKVLQVRALFEDYGNGVRNDAELVQAIDVIRESKEKAGLEKKSSNRADYKTKKEYKEALKYNEEIDIAGFVCDELNKFSKKTTQAKLQISKSIVTNGINGLHNLKPEKIKADLKAAKKLSKNSADEKEFRQYAIDTARNNMHAYKTIQKYFRDKELDRPDFDEIEKLYETEDNYDIQIKALYTEQAQEKKAKNRDNAKAIGEKIKTVKTEKSAVQDKIKAEMEKHVQFSRAAKPFLDAEKLLKEEENYKHFDEIELMYDEAKVASEAERQAQIDEQKRLEAEKETKINQMKAEKERLKAEKKNKNK